MGREPYRCTYCTQTSSRKWNLKIHIQRKHNGIGNPFKSAPSPPSGVGQFAPSDTGKWPSDNNHPGFIAKRSHQSDRAFFATNSTNSLAEDLLQAIEIKNIVNEIKPANNQPSGSDHTPILISSILSRKSSDASIFLLLSILNENKQVGFRGHGCHNCLSFWIDLLYDNREELKSLLRSVKPIPHTCNPKKIADAHKVRDIEIKKKELENQLVNSLLSLTHICALFRSKKPYFKDWRINISA